MIGYFKHILENTVKGTYKGQDERGLQRFAVRANTRLVQRLHVVEHLHPQVTRNPESEWEVVVVYPKAETLIVDQPMPLILIFKGNKGKCKESTIRGHRKNLSLRWDSNPRPSVF